MQRSSGWVNARYFFFLVTANMVHGLAVELTVICLHWTCYICLQVGLGFLKDFFQSKCFCDTAVVVALHFSFALVRI